MNNDKNQIPSTVQNLIDMFFAQKKLYERMTGVCVPSSITYTKNCSHEQRNSLTINS